MTDPVDLGVPEGWPRLPEALVGPLLETAGEVLRVLPPEEVPAAARNLTRFDRRGLATPAARSQLLRVVESHPDLAGVVVAALGARDDVTAVAEGWDRDGPGAAVVAAAASGTLPLLASYLWACRPPAWEFGLGLALASFQFERGEEERAAETRKLEGRLAEAVEARRRAEEAKAVAEDKVARLDEERRSARREQRAQEAGETQELAGARRRAEQAETALGEARARLAEAEARAVREATRARGAEERERALRADLEAGLAAFAAGGATSAAALAEVADTATALATRLRQLSREAGATKSPPPAEKAKPPAQLPRRTPVQVPPGMRGDEPAAAEAMVRTPGVAVIVDGYNVSMVAWPEATKALQRERLNTALAELHLRARCHVTVVYDGADVEGVKPKRHKGVTTLFSPADVEADDIIVEQVRTRPRSVPVVVVTSDAAVRNRVEIHGAQVIANALFLGVLRR